MINGSKKMFTPILTGSDAGTNRNTVRPVPCSEPRSSSALGLRPLLSPALCTCFTSFSVIKIFNLQSDPVRVCIVGPAFSLCLSLFKAVKGMKCCGDCAVQDTHLSVWQVGSLRKLNRTRGVSEIRHRFVQFYKLKY